MWRPFARGRGFLQWFIGLFVGFFSSTSEPDVQKPTVNSFY